MIQVAMQLVKKCFDGSIEKMKLRLFLKLTVVFFGLTIFILLVTLGLARWSFERGFLDYVNALEYKRLYALADRLERDYIDAGNTWAGFSRGDLEFAQRYSHQGDGPKLNLSNHRSHRHYGEKKRYHSRGKKKKKSSYPHSQNGKTHRVKTALYGVDGELIAGSAIMPGADFVTVPVTVAAKKVGELRALPRRVLDSSLETEFSKQQLRTSLIIGFICLIMAAVASLLLARALLSPIRQLALTVYQLRSGNYKARLKTRRKDELGQLMRNVNLLADRLQENSKARKRWVADISHELRTPLTIISGELEALKDGVRSFDSDQIVSFDQEVSRLRSLINDLYELSLSDIGGLRYAFEQLDIVIILQGAIKAIAAPANDLGISITLSGSQSVDFFGDPKRLDQLFRNLLRNSLAYTNSPGRIEIVVSIRKGIVVIQFDDTPTGVSEANCKKLFDPLYREEASRYKRSAGAGLGLSICRNIVIAHQGTICAQPSRLGGLCVRMAFKEGGR